MRTVATIFLVLAVGLSSACVRERDKPKTEAPLPPPQTRGVKPAPTADHDLSGRKRAKPPTMGALEADPTPPPRRGLPKKPKRPPADERAK